MTTSGMLRHVAAVKTNFLEEHIAYDTFLQNVGSYDSHMA
jgi:hypothetical protein